VSLLRVRGPDKREKHSDIDLKGKSDTTGESFSFIFENKRNVK
jgi:hypothetical protein